MRIRLNGEPHDLDGPLSVSALLAGLNIDARRVAVEHNLVVVKRAKYDETTINEGDEIEIVNFVGGGGHPSVPGFLGFLGSGVLFGSEVLLGSGVPRFPRFLGQ